MADPKNRWHRPPTVPRDNKRRKPISPLSPSASGLAKPPARRSYDFLPGRAVEVNSIKTFIIKGGCRAYRSHSLQGRRTLRSARRDESPSQAVDKHIQIVKQPKPPPSSGNGLYAFKKIVRRIMAALYLISTVFKLKKGYFEKEREKFNAENANLGESLYSRQMLIAGAVFNKYDFIPKRQVILQKDVRYALTIPTDRRTAEDVEKILMFMQTVRAFSEYPYHVQKMLSQVTWYQRVPPNKVIIRQGHPGHNFYFVLSGKANIKVIEMRSDGTIMNEEKVVFKVERGNSFGDIALLHNVERTATVESSTEMSLLMVSRDDFLRIFMQRDQHGLTAEQIQFIKSVSALKYWPLERISTSKDDCIFHYFKRGKLIVADSCSSDYIYIVKHGSCAVYTQLLNVKPQSFSLIGTKAKQALEARLDPFYNVPKSCISDGRRRSLESLEEVQEFQQDSGLLTTMETRPRTSYPSIGRSQRDAKDRWCRSKWYDNENAIEALERVNNANIFLTGKTSSSPSPIEHKTSFEDDEGNKVTPGHNSVTVNKPSPLKHTDSVESTEKTGGMMLSHEGKQQHVPRWRNGRHSGRPGCQVFVRLAVLGPRDAFGLESLHLDGNENPSETSVALVSQGAEVVMLKKTFFMQNCNSETLKHLRTTILSYPSEKTLQENLQTSVNWHTFRGKELDHLMNNRSKD